MSVHAFAPEASTRPFLADAGFADAYRLTIVGPPIDAAMAAERVFARRPGWISALIALRNRLVAPIGLKGTQESELEKAAVNRPRRIGFFPVVSQTSDRVAMGFDDWHLDFRVIVDVLSLGLDRQEVTVTTLVRTHNLVGRIYLLVITPFHRVVVRTMLAQAARP
jgi:hypothetical protein